MHALYPLVRAARYLGVPPWELYARGAHWVSLAVAFEKADERSVLIAREIEEANKPDADDEDDD